MTRAAYEAMTILARYPALALPAARRRGHGVVLDAGTDILIEGYPRTGNSFAVAAFAASQPGPVRIAHHVHAPAHVLAAVRAGIPAIVLVRRPEEAVVDFLEVKPHLTAGQALRGYRRFYAPLVGFRDRLVVARFEDVMRDFGAVIRRVNERFHTSFREFEHTEENVRASLEAIDRYWAGREGPGLPLVGRTSRADRGDPVRDSLRAAYRDGRLLGLRSATERLYETLTSG